MKQEQASSSTRVGRAVGSRDEEVALGLMNMALALLDRAGSAYAALHLQHSIDTLCQTGRHSPSPEEIEAVVGRWARNVEYFASDDGGRSPEGAPAG